MTQREATLVVAVVIVLLGAAVFVLFRWVL
jgi:hypothetical protein